MRIGFHVKYPLFLLDYNETLTISTDFEKYWNIYFMKILPVGSEVFHVDGQMDRQTVMTKLIIGFSQFSEPA
jgi:hypothetical protein